MSIDPPAENDPTQVMTIRITRLDHGMSPEPGESQDRSATAVLEHDPVSEEPPQPEAGNDRDTARRVLLSEPGQNPAGR